ncbi:hypothetical protein GCM10009000_102520 [Halobacterium noricense]
MADCFDAEDVVFAVPSDYRSVVAGTELVVGKSGERAEAFLGLLGRFIDLVHHAVGHLRVEVL